MHGFHYSSEHLFILALNSFLHRALLLADNDGQTQGAQEWMMSSMAHREQAHTGVEMT
jgi:hypothetical protein